MDNEGNRFGTGIENKMLFLEAMMIYIKDTPIDMYSQEKFWLFKGQDGYEAGMAYAKTHFLQNDMVACNRLKVLQDMFVVEKRKMKANFDSDKPTAVT